MKNRIFEKLTQAIDEHRLVLVTDEAGPRVIEPYLLFESAEGDMLLHGWQQAGAFRQTPPPRWCNLHLGDIQNVTVLAEQFPKPHRDYNPNSSQFSRVVYAISGNTMVKPTPPAPDPRVKRERRGPPKGRADQPGRSSRWDFRP